MSSNTLSVCFVGDSGDGMQLIGQRFTFDAIDKGYEVQTYPDFPAEIRAPAGTIAGVSGFQVSVSNELALYDIAEKVDVLVAMNPAALKKGLGFLKKAGIIILNSDNFKQKDLSKADICDDNELEKLLNDYQVYRFNITTQTQEALTDIEISNTQAKKSKNIYVLGIILWMFDLQLTSTLAFIDRKFKNKPQLAQANIQALKAGYHFALTLELPQFELEARESVKSLGNCRYLTGIEAISLSLATIAVKNNLPLLVSGYPITPASGILHEAVKLKHFGITTFQAEDEIASICSAIGASFAGTLALTCTSGPGMDLKSESLGLAVMAELPLVVIDVQRAGPSTGLPTKTEQSDLNLALFGRHGEAPLPVLAANSPTDCFYRLIEAFRIAVTYMTPVILLMDAYIANNASRFKLPNLEAIKPFDINFNQQPAPFVRNQYLARSWPLPGSAGYEYQLGGLEKEGPWGQVSYDPNNHQEMIELRSQKIQNIKAEEPFNLYGVNEGKLLVVAWGGTYGAVRTAVDTLIKEGTSIAFLHINILFPLPIDLESIFANYQKIVVAELNQGQLYYQLRAKFLIDACLINQCNGQPFRASRLVEKLRRFL